MEIAGSSCSSNGVKGLLACMQPCNEVFNEIKNFLIFSTTLAPESSIGPKRRCEETSECFLFSAYTSIYAYGRCNRWIDLDPLTRISNESAINDVCVDCSARSSCSECLGHLGCGWCFSNEVIILGSLIKL